jgi:hypothetical protein
MEVSTIHIGRREDPLPYAGAERCRTNTGLSVSNMCGVKRAYHQRLGGWGASRHINIHRHNPITTPRNTVTIMVITTSIRTASHGNNPSWVRHLIVDLSQRRSHLVRKRAGNDHDIRLARRSTEDYTKTILIIAGSGKVHHFDGAAGKSEGHGPE